MLNSKYFIFVLLLLQNTAFANGFVIKAGVDCAAFAASIWNAVSADNAHDDMEDSYGRTPDRPGMETKTASALSLFSSAFNGAILLADAIPVVLLIQSVGIKNLMGADFTKQDAFKLKLLAGANVIPLIFNVASFSLLAKSTYQIPNIAEARDMISEMVWTTIASATPAAFNAASIASAIWYLRYKYRPNQLVLDDDNL